MPTARLFPVATTTAALAVLVLAGAACRQAAPPTAPPAAPVAGAPVVVDAAPFELDGRPPLNDRFVEARRTLAEWAKRPHFTRCIGFAEETSARLEFVRARVARPEVVTLFHFHAVCDPNHPDAAGALLEDRMLLARVCDARLYDLWNADDLVAFAAAERLPLKDAAEVRAFFGADHDPLLTVEPDGRDARRWRLVRAFSGRDLLPTVRVVVLDDAGVPLRIDAAR
ncbi:MAG: hypothetical protein JNL90_12120 [Planctomycetes bacterium]|nr:hypothetical protein [Planctomycetota bacterium]